MFGPEDVARTARESRLRAPFGSSASPSRRVAHRLILATDRRTDRVQDLVVGRDEHRGAGSDDPASSDRRSPSSHATYPRTGPSSIHQTATQPYGMTARTRELEGARLVRGLRSLLRTGAMLFPKLRIVLPVAAALGLG